MWPMPSPTPGITIRPTGDPMNLFQVLWLDASENTYRGSAATLEAALTLARTAIPRGCNRFIVKLGRKIVARGSI
jgi:hypothetical protein